MTNEPIACAAGGIDITGCRVSLYPMKDHFAQQIVTSIERTDTTAVWQQTDLFSTLFRGKPQVLLMRQLGYLSTLTNPRHTSWVSLLFPRAVLAILQVTRF